MPKISKLNLRQLFAKGVKPLQESFYNLFDSYWHKDDEINISVVKDLQESLDKKLDIDAQDSLLESFNDALTEIHKVVDSDFKGVLQPTDPAPTLDGSYKPAVSSELNKPTDPNSTAEWGAKYPNAGNLRAKQGYDTMFYKQGSVWTKAENKIDVNSEKLDKTSKALKYFLELPSEKPLLDYTFKINNTSNYTIYGVTNQFQKVLKSDNSIINGSGAGQYFNVWKNIPTVQGNKRITKVLLNVTPYGNNAIDVLKNTTLLGVANGIVYPLVVGNTVNPPTVLQTYDIDVSIYDSISIGLYVLDNTPATNNQVLDFYCSDITGDQNSVKKYIDTKTAGSGGSKGNAFIDLIDYGCAGDGVTDDTAKINAAILELMSKGGGTIYGRTNKFKVSSISIPDNKKWQTIEIKGESIPVPVFGTIGEFEVNGKNQMEIISDLQNPNRGVINVESGSAYATFNLVFLSLKNLRVKTYNNPNCHGINALNAIQLNVENVCVDTGVYSVQASEPTRLTAGLITPKNSNGAFTLLRFVSISGYDRGIDVYEHTDGDAICLGSCKKGLNILSGDHASYFKRVLAQRNTIHVNVGGSHLFEIAQLNMEFAGAGQTDSNNVWQATQYELSDPSNLGVGNITYANVKGGVGKVNTFRINGGAGIIVKKVGSENRLTGSGIAG